MGIRVLQRLGRWGKRFFNRHLCVCAALLLCTLLFAGVPQVRTVWFSQMPSPQAPIDWQACWFLFLIFMLLDFGFYWVSIFWVPRPPQCGGVFARVFDQSVGWLVKFSNHCAAPTRFLAGVTLFVAGMALLGIDIWTDIQDNLTLLGHALPRNMGTWLMLTGFWLLLCTALAADEPLSSESVRPTIMILLSVGRVLAWLLIAGFMGEVLWALACSPRWISDTFSFRLYALWALLHIMAVITVLAAVLDHLDQHTGLPMRLVGGLLYAAILLVFQPHTNADVTMLPVAQGNLPLEADEVNDVWYQHLEQRLLSIPPNDPVVIVAASGGGSRRRDLYGADTRVPVAGAHPRLARPTHLGPEHYPDEQRFRRQPGDGALRPTSLGSERRTLRPDVHDQRRIDRRRRRRVLAAVSGNRRAQPTSTDDDDWINSVHTASRLVDDLAIHREATDTADGPGKVVLNKFIDDMCANFMAPICAASPRPTCIAASRWPVFGRSSTAGITTTICRATPASALGSSAAPPVPACCSMPPTSRTARDW